MTKAGILRQFSLFSLGGDGIAGWLTEQTDERIFARLDTIHTQPLTKAQLNQLLVLGHQASVSTGFFTYYWLECPHQHPYQVDHYDAFDPAWIDKTDAIITLAHLQWGLHRLFTDGLLYFGNVRAAYRALRILSRTELETFFQNKRFDTEAITQRGQALPLREVPQDDRYLISEMACKSFGDTPDDEGDMRHVLKQAYSSRTESSRRSVTFRQLISDNLPPAHEDRQSEFEFAMDDILDQSIESEQDFDTKFGQAADKFFAARKEALANTEHYLSMANDLDVYVATSMRKREDFREMARFCTDVFDHKSLVDLHLRYFDPTLSAALGHEDKGLIECLMVKCSKVLVYCAGKSDSYGKDAEAAMALSLGKPVIFYCDQEKRRRFYQDVHPLSRLIEFETGVSVGAMVTDSIDDVRELLRRLVRNEMEYNLEHHPSRPKYLRIKERLTESVVRVQTDNQMLTETFWNHYHNQLG